MSFEQRGEAVMAALSLSDLKLVYRVLHERLGRYPDLMDTHFLIELQSFLHKQATADGVDIAVHGDWEAWLNRP